MCYVPCVCRRSLSFARVMHLLFVLTFSLYSKVSMADRQPVVTKRGTLDAAEESTTCRYSTCNLHYRFGRFPSRGLIGCRGSRRDCLSWWWWWWL